MVLTSEKLEEAAEELKPLEQEQLQIFDELEVDETSNEIKLSWLRNSELDSEGTVVKLLSKEFKINLSEAKKSIRDFPRQYVVGEKGIPDVIKSLRKYRRTLKGETKISLTKSIETLINAYTSHLDDCIKSIYWLSKYEIPLKNRISRHSM